MSAKTSKSGVRRPCTMRACGSRLVLPHQKPFPGHRCQGSRSLCLVLSICKSCCCHLPKQHNSESQLQSKRTSDILKSCPSGFRSNPTNPRRSHACTALLTPVSAKLMYTSTQSDVADRGAEDPTIRDPQLAQNLDSRLQAPRIHSQFAAPSFWGIEENMLGPVLTHSARANAGRESLAAGISGALMHVPSPARNKHSCNPMLPMTLPDQPCAP